MIDLAGRGRSGVGMAVAFPTGVLSRGGKGIIGTMLMPIDVLALVDGQ